ncbi:hypothetical protein TNCV_476171 [Trichonephila clavipes]|nr:hypothetical protein TNCV_476171 [Trichonephila clavipes]
MKGILETGGVMGKCVQMWTRNYGALDQTARVCFGVLCANRKKEEVKRDFGPANKKERGACCEHTLVFKKKGLFLRTEGDRKKRPREREKESPREREREAHLEWRKGLSPEIGVKGTMNAGGVEYGNRN